VLDQNVISLVPFVAQAILARAGLGQTILASADLTQSILA
jgi:hypothetical protein